MIADAPFVPVHLGRVDVAVADLEGLADDRGRLVGRDLVGAEPQWGIVVESFRAMSGITHGTDQRPAARGAHGPRPARPAVARGPAPVASAPDDDHEGPGRDDEARDEAPVERPLAVVGAGRRRAAGDGVLGTTRLPRQRRGPPWPAGSDHDHRAGPPRRPSRSAATTSPWSTTPAPRRRCPTRGSWPAVERTLPVIVTYPALGDPGDPPMLLGGVGRGG